MRVPRWRPSKRFTAWVRAYGLYGIEKAIGVTRWAVRQWLKGECAPREDNARAIMLLSQQFPKDVGPLTYEDIYGNPGDP